MNITRLLPIALLQLAITVYKSAFHRVKVAHTEGYPVLCTLYSRPYTRLLPIPIKAPLPPLMYATLAVART